MDQGSRGVCATHLHRVGDILVIVVIDFLKEIFTELSKGEENGALGRERRLIDKAYK